MAKSVKISICDWDMKLYDAEPDGTALGAIMVLQEACGVKDHIEDICQRFAAEGFRVNARAFLGPARNCNA